MHFIFEEGDRVWVNERGLATHGLVGTIRTEKPRKGEGWARGRELLFFVDFDRKGHGGVWLAPEVLSPILPS